MTNAEEKTEKLPYLLYFLQPLLFSFIGLADSIYLSISHYRTHTDLYYSSFCAISNTINCDMVSQSPWSVLINLPAPLWGVFAYLLYLLLLLAMRKDNDNWRSVWCFLFTLGMIYSFSSIVFAFISIKIIRAYCIPCIVSYGANLLLWFYPWFIRRRFDRTPFLKCLKQAFSTLRTTQWLKKALLSLAGIFIALQIFLPRYWEIHPRMPSELPNGLTEEGHPWLGAENPTLTIHVFSDYLCFRCYQYNFFLRQFASTHPKDVRIVHHHYPLDHEFNPIAAPKPFHIGAGKTALLAIYAADKGLFWKTNDLLFLAAHGDKNELDLKAIAESAGLDPREIHNKIFSPNTMKHLEKDIRLGLNYRIIATPSFVIGKEVFTGFLPADILKNSLP
ncbi:MAG: vitamin K epoxide reductase family protein [Pseudomonadota bacterium]